MSYLKKSKYLLFAILFLALTGCPDEKKPEITPPPPEVPEIINLAPEILYSGNEFLIIGKNFGASTVHSMVLVGEKSAIIEEWNDTLIKAYVIIDIGVYQVKVVFDDTTTLDAGYLTFIAEDEILPPQIISISPNEVDPGQMIDITGINLGDIQGTSYVSIGAIIVENYSTWSNANIKCKVPDNISPGTYQLVVVVDNETSNSVEIKVKEPIVEPPDPDEPVINEITQTSAKVGDTVTITGEYFGAAHSTTSDVYLSNVFADNVKCSTYIIWNETTIKFIVPTGIPVGEATVKVKVGDYTSNGKNITILTPPPPNQPTIDSTDKDPTKPAKDGEYDAFAALRIFGKNFGSSANQGKVMVSKGSSFIEATITQWRDDQIRITLPAGATSGRLYVQTNTGIKGNEYPIFVHLVDQYKTVFIPKGTFTMGDNSSSKNGEAPEHQVTITYDFYIAETEVSQQQYRTIMGALPPSVDPLDLEIPVHQLSWIQALQFCNTFSSKAGLDPVYTISGNNATCDWTKNGYRLPTEAEWEYVARAGTNSAWGFTGEPNNNLWYKGNYTAGSKQAPKKVGQRMKNLWGVYDMHGNVAEWCWDSYSTTYYSECANGVTNPRGTSEVQERKVIRGGDFESELDECKATTRNSYTGGSGNYKIGFRFVRNR